MEESEGLDPSSKLQDHSRKLRQLIAWQDAAGTKFPALQGEIDQMRSEVEELGKEGKIMEEKMLEAEKAASCAMTVQREFVGLKDGFQNFYLLYRLSTQIRQIRQDTLNLRQDYDLMLHWGY